MYTQKCLLSINNYKECFPLPAELKPQSLPSLVGKVCCCLGWATKMIWLNNLYIRVTHAFPGTPAYRVVFHTVSWFNTNLWFGTAVGLTNSGFRRFSLTFTNICLTKENIVTSINRKTQPQYLIVWIACRINERH